MADSLTELVIKLLKNGFHYRYLKMTGKAGRPQALSLEITHRCIARCIMCNIWKIPHHIQDLPLNDWLQLLSSPLFSELRELDVTGGEPFLRKDLPDLFSGITDLKRKNLAYLRSVALTTNGILTERILEDTEEIIQRLRDASIDLVMVCAMDAVGGVHDKIRNYPDAWNKVHQTVQGLVKLRESFPNLVIGLKTTVLPINIDQLDQISNYAQSYGLFTIISPCIITGGRYLNRERAGDLAFSRKDREKMIEFFHTETFRWGYHREALIAYLKTGVMKKPCSCGFNYLFIRSNGDLFLCPLISISSGNVKEKNVEALFHSEVSDGFRRKVGRHPECRECTEPGLERYALPYEGFTYLSWLFKMGRTDFLECHRHMGLDKYFL
jgi:MoaA/NifB/PqqE/SkfB family radical SAM enzyme